MIMEHKLSISTRYHYFACGSVYILCNKALNINGYSVFRVTSCMGTSESSESLVKTCLIAKGAVKPCWQIFR